MLSCDAYLQIACHVAVSMHYSGCIILYGRRLKYVLYCIRADLIDTVIPMVIKTLHPSATRNWRPPFYVLCVSFGLLITSIHFADSTCLLSSPNVSTASSLETLIAGTLQPWHNHSTILAQTAQGLHNVLLYYSTLLAHCLHFLVDSLLF